MATAIRFDYGEIRPWLRRHGDGLYTAVGGNDAVVISSDADIAATDDEDLVARFELRDGERVRLSLTWFAPEEIDPFAPAPPGPTDLDLRFEETMKWWRKWSIKAAGASEPACRRSSLVLKALTHAPTGAVVAAPTTSLPETLGGDRNWDYRFSWIRDSQFTVRSLGEVGCDTEADGFRRFVERSAAGRADSLQIMYGVGGERRLAEMELRDLAGYRGSKPVRIGNAASTQLQLDVYGVSARAGMAMA
jgi:GH15 family glucan-1,4-alpha-glucosidase